MRSAPNPAVGPFRRRASACHVAVRCVPQGVTARRAVAVSVVRRAGWQTRWFFSFFKHALDGGGPRVINATFERTISFDKLPKYQDGWEPVLDALRNGNFFVTTGEILIPRCNFSGKESGETLPSIDLRHILLDIELEWTYPLAFMEVVSGDGKKVYRQRIDLSDTQEFQSRKIQKSIDLRGRHWVRIEVWDIAKNGAFTVPVWIER